MCYNPLMDTVEKRAKTALVTGASRGIGHETAMTLHRQGWTVYGLSRSLRDDVPYMQISADVTDAQALARAVARIEEEQGKIDVLIANAGMGVAGPVEETTAAEDRDQFEVNFFGALNCVKAVLPGMRTAREGRVIIVSSAAALFPIPFQSMYSASKAALRCLALALANEVGGFGIQVCAVMPGDSATSFTSSRRKAPYETSAYARYRPAIERMERDETNGAPASAVAAVICGQASSRKMKSTVTVGAAYKLLVFASRLLPVKLVNGIIGRMY